MMLMKPLERAVTTSSLVPTTPFLNADHFPWARLLEENWRTIRQELDEVLIFQDDLPAFHEISPDVADISDERWRTFFFCSYGHRSDANRARCPGTAALLDQIPGLTTAMFSILAPGKRIPAHRGPWTGVLRYHLGLRVPEPALCGITVGGQTAHWREGESLLFDDSYEHSAWNDSDGTRVVLFLDVPRPCRFPGAWINRAVLAGATLTPFMLNATANHRAWERRFAAKHPAPPRADG
ncbi:aspartyl/asparaginyl beta-hydroxylase domain-containing protein [Kitasatospora sp. NPDC098652]|uniref:aspartyl/asparaginyl beta-hydroxylase domain-containing protein n=1 Tax=Kitasatospora sp. NPDC098652 TaxID=3364095 RepID=UPI00382FC7BF